MPITDKFGIQYKTVENFFQACKTTDPNIRQQVAQMPPAQAKKYCGRNGQVQPHSNWEPEKLRVMLHALRHKFAPGSKWAERLEQTGEERIRELNNWHDNHWGACICSKCNPLPKLNLLGKLLMHVRQENRQLEQSGQLGLSSPIAPIPSMPPVGVAVGVGISSPSSTAYPSPSGQLRSDLKIVSGGQAWGDREPLEAAQQLGIPTGGWAPAGWLVEGGSDPSLAQFGVKEAPAGNSMGHTYIIRTRLNVQDSDGTVVFGGIDNQYIDHMIAWSQQNPHLQERDWEAYCRQNSIKINGDIGSSRTIQFAHFAGKPWMQFDLNEIGTPQARQSVASQLREWVISSNIQVLNAAGNRGSKVPIAYHGALREIITLAFQVPIVERLHQSVGQNGTSASANMIAPVMKVKEISAGKSCNLPVRIDEHLHPQEIEELRQVLPNLIRQSIGQAYRMGYDQINFSISATDERLGYLQEAIATAQSTLDPDIKMTVNLSNQHPQLSRQDSLLIVTAGRDKKTLTFIQNFQQIQIEGYNLNTKSEFLIPPANNPTYNMGKHLEIDR